MLGQDASFRSSSLPFRPAPRSSRDDARDDARDYSPPRGGPRRRSPRRGSVQPLYYPPSSSSASFVAPTSARGRRSSDSQPGYAPSTRYEPSQPRPRVVNSARAAPGPTFDSDYEPYELVTTSGPSANRSHRGRSPQPAAFSPREGASLPPSQSSRTSRYIPEDQYAGPRQPRTHSPLDIAREEQRMGMPPLTRHPDRFTLDDDYPSHGRRPRSVSTSRGRQPYPSARSSSVAYGPSDYRGPPSSSRMSATASDLYGSASGPRRSRTVDHTRQRSYPAGPARTDRHSASPSDRGSQRGSEARSRSTRSSSLMSPSHKDLEQFKKLGKAAIEAGAIAAFRARDKPGPWLGPKGAGVATAIIGTALIDGLVERKPTVKKGGVRHSAMKSATTAALSNFVLGPLADKHGLQNRQ